MSCNPEGGGFHHEFSSSSVCLFFGLASSDIFFFFSSFFFSFSISSVDFCSPADSVWKVHQLNQKETTQYLVTKLTNERSVVVVWLTPRGLLALTLTLMIQSLCKPSSCATKMLQPINLGVIKKIPGAIPGVWIGASGSSIKVTFWKEKATKYK